MLPSNKFKLSSLAFAVCLASSPLLFADTEAPAPDEIVLIDGSRILGTVTESRDGVVTVETDFAGTLSVSMDKIDTLKTSESVVLLLADDTVIRDQPLLIEDQQLVLAEGSFVGPEYPLQELQVVNPEPWELGQGYKWTGLINFAMSMERGNTDTDELDYKLDTQWRSKRDRYTFRWNGEIDEANGEKNADNWQAVAKYDYFLTEPNYWGMLVAAEKDKFKDLDLRYMVGPYLGRQLFDQPIFSLQAELGVSYVNEEYNVAEDQDYPASNWSLHATSDYLGGDSKLYFDQIGIWNLDETSDVVVNSTFGLSFPLLWNFEAAAEILWEYDSGAVDNVDDLDETYKVRIGYTW